MEKKSTNDITMQLLIDENSRLKTELIISDTCRGCVYGADGPIDDSGRCQHFNDCDTVKKALVSGDAWTGIVKRIQQPSV